MIVIALPLLVMGMVRIRTAYRHIGRQLAEVDETTPPRCVPAEQPTVLVPVSGLNEK